MARKNTGKKREIKEVLQDILNAENKAYEEAGIARTFVVSFPNRQKAPLLGRLGVFLFSMAGGIIQINFHQVDKK